MAVTARSGTICDTYCYYKYTNLTSVGVFVTTEATRTRSITAVNSYGASSVTVSPSGYDSYYYILARLTGNWSIDTSGNFSIQVSVVPYTADNLNWYSEYTISALSYTIYADGVSIKSGTFSNKNWTNQSGQSISLGTISISSLFTSDTDYKDIRVYMYIDKVYFSDHNNHYGYHRITMDGTLALPTTKPKNYVYIYNGSSWKTAIPYIYNGSAWKEVQGYIFNGSSWKQISSG